MTNFDRNCLLIASIKYFVWSYNRCIY